MCSERFWGYYILGRKNAKQNADTLKKPDIPEKNADIFE